MVLALGAAMDTVAASPSSGPSHTLSSLLSSMRVDDAGSSDGASPSTTDGPGGHVPDGARARGLQSRGVPGEPLLPMDAARVHLAPLHVFEDGEVVAWQCDATAADPRASLVYGVVMERVSNDWGAISRVRVAVDAVGTCRWLLSTELWSFSSATAMSGHDGGAASAAANPSARPAYGGRLAAGASAVAAGSAGDNSGAAVSPTRASAGPASGEAPSLGEAEMVAAVNDVLRKVRRDRSFVQCVFVHVHDVPLYASRWLCDWNLGVDCGRSGCRCRQTCSR